MELRDIYELWDRFDRSAVDEMELNMHGDSFHLRKASPCVSGSKDSQFFLPQTNSVAQAPKDISAEPAMVQGAEAEKSEAEQLYTAEIKAPLVGTFYAASSPDAEPFIKVGQEVHKGDVIGIIEAMKLMNEVTANVDGTVVEILAEDGKMVEYDQVLVRLS